MSTSAEAWVTHPIVLCIAFPFAAGLLCLVLPRGAERARSALAVLSTVLGVLLVWPLFAAAGARLELGAWLAFRVDALSATLALAASVFGVLVALYSVPFMAGRERHREYFAYLLWTMGATFGVVVANDLLVMLAFWGFLALTLYLMIGIAGPAAAEAARKTLMIVGGTDALLLFAIALVWTLSGTTRMDAPVMPMDGVGAHIAYLSFVAAAFAKAGAVPFHSWVPDCGEKADAPVTALLPASLDKLLGVYLLVRCVMDWFEPSTAMQSLLMLLGAITVLAGAAMALVQSNLKRLLAYSTVSQVGYVVLGIGTGTALGLAAGLFHALNHAVYKCCLFLCAGAVEKAAGTSDLDRLGGLSKTMPLTFAVCVIAALSISGIPPLNGFASKWMVYQAIIVSGDPGDPMWILWLVAAMLGSALTLAAFVKMLHATFLCKPAPELSERPVREVGAAMALPMVLLAGLCIIFGVFATAVPLRWLVFPVVPAQETGVWWAGLATVLILSAIGAGAIVYALAFSFSKLRRCETYVGGERLDQVYLRGEFSGPTRHVEVTGVDFYRTIEQLPGLGRLYVLARARAFDVYYLGAACGAYFTGLLRSAHTGALPVYLTWFLAGLLAVIYAVSRMGASQ